jgi:hypothetical protein
MKSLIEIYNLVLESKKTEEQAQDILLKSKFSEEEIFKIINELKKIDTSENQKYLPMMATVFSWGEKNYETIKDIFDDYDELFLNNNIGKMFSSNMRIKILEKDGKEKEFNDFLKFTEYIHGIRDNAYKKKYGYSYEEYKSEDTPILSSNGIDIYEANSVGKCIKYTQGKLTGKYYSFCIGQPMNTMYQSYRDKKVSTFYFIVDRNRFKTNSNGSVNLDDPLHIVVLDVTSYGIELTDANNTTGKVAEYGTNVDGYVSYLKSKGIPVDRLVNKPKTPEEKEEEELLGNTNDSLEWFMQLPYEMKSKYIGRGHKLTDEQFDIILSDKKLLNQYLNIGNTLSDSQFKIIENIPSALNSYIKSRKIAISNGEKVSLVELDYLPLETIDDIKLIDSNHPFSDFGNKKLKEIPDSIRNLRNLITLKFISNGIEEIPDWIDELKYLSYIYLSNNKIQNLPESITNLKYLTELDLSNNNIRELPNSFKKLTSLKKLILFGNEIPEEKIIILKELLPTCEIVYEQKDFNQWKRKQRRRTI